MLPLLTLSDHTLPITSIRLGFGTLSSARIFSSSLDSTVKVWSIDAHTSADSAGPSSTLLATFGFSVSIIDIAIDPLERFFFAATSKDNGEIFVTRMYTDNQDVPHRSLLTGGIGETHAVSSSNAKSITAGSKVSTLALTTTSQLLIGTHSGLIHVYDTLSLQLLRTISTSQSPSPTPVTFLTTVPKPIDLIGHVQLYMDHQNQGESMSVRPVMPFGRVREVKGAGREVSLILPPRPNLFDVSYDPAQDAAYFSAKATLTAADKSKTADSQARIESLELQVQQLTAKLNQAKAINDAIWEKMVDRIAQQNKATQPTSL